MDQMSTLAAPRVQIIDPDGKFREALATHLRGCGYWVEACGSLDAGLPQAAKDRRRFGDGLASSVGRFVSGNRSKSIVLSVTRR
jgi:hypothetical protein